MQDSPETDPRAAPHRGVQPRA